MNREQILSGLILLNMTEIIRRAITKTASAELSGVINGTSIELTAENLAISAIRSNLEEK